MRIIPTHCLYLPQNYDRVLWSRSVPTLIGLASTGQRDA
jgi:ABC-type protease/lipase transport system fused ATPase/permease subunit